MGKERCIMFTRLQQPLNKFTFKAPKVREWLVNRCSHEYAGTLNLFSGPTELSIQELRVDIDPNVRPHIVMEVCDFVEKWARIKPVFKFKTIVIDPPYSYRKSMELYNGHLNSRFKRLLDILPEILDERGRVITFGYHSSVMSKKRGFRIVEILLISHGGAIHDTIATVEERVTVSPFGLYCSECNVAIDYENSMYSDNPIRCKGCFEKWKKTVS